MAVVMPATVIASSVAAQILTEPTPTTKSSGRGAPAPERAKAYATYGAGLVQMLGSDACIKIGGYVTIQGGISSGH